VKEAAMDERMTVAPAELPRPEMPAEARAAGVAAPAGAAGLGDARALTILTTEHWSLLSARALVYNEAFARASMFLTFVSATLVALGLIATATAFSREFLGVTVVVLGLDVFIGLATFGRIGNAAFEDIQYLQGMARIRHAYHEILPGLEPYFITSKYDDVRSVVSFYGRPRSTGMIHGVLHGLTTTAGMVSFICIALVGVILAVVTLLVTESLPLAAFSGLAGFLVLEVATTVSIARWASRRMLEERGRFPAPPG
jgi:hypothetical protein